MTDDNEKALARTDLERMLGETKRFADKRGFAFSHLAFEHILGSSAGSFSCNGDGTMIGLLIGMRGNLTRASAKCAARAFRELVRTHPKAEIAIVVAGYDTDAREIPDIPQAAEHFRRFARFAGFASVHDALASPLHRHAVGLLAKCACWPGEVNPDDVPVVGGPPSAMKH
jgi:hypothetical protein